MQIIIVGDGKVGVALTEQLSSEGHDITVIDSNPKVLEQSLESYDVMVVHGNGASIGVLKEAGVEDAHLLIAATSRDETNLLTCIVAKKLGAKHTIARVRNPEYAEQLVLMRDELGLSMTINPELAAAREIHHLLQFPSFLKRDSFAKGRVEIVEIHVGEDSKLAGIPLNRLYEIARVRVLVCVVERGGTVHIPDGSFTLQAGDNIYVTADSQDLAQLIKHLGIVKQKVRNAIIVGGSRIAYYLAMRCLHAGLGVKIIEQNKNRCEHLSELLPDATIINGDGTNRSLLLEEGLSESESFVTLTNLDEENVFLALFAKSISDAKLVAKVNRLEFDDVIDSLDIGSVIYPKNITADYILQYVRATQNSIGSNVETLYHILDGNAEALEFAIREESAVTYIPLAELNLRKNLLVGCLNRNGRIRIPRGQDMIQVGDTVIIVTTHKGLRDITDILEK